MSMYVDRPNLTIPDDRGPGSPLRLLLNVAWLISGGAFAGLGWLLAAAIMAITIIGLPWAFAAFRIGLYTFMPFGQDILRRPDSGILSTLGNIVWFVLAGWWLAIGHLVLAVSLALTIIGLPFAWAHLKLAGASLFPVGTLVVPRL